jgi:hypothetical protein
MIVAMARPEAMVGIGFARGCEYWSLAQVANVRPRP